MAKGGYLARLGVYGFDAVEPVILAALVTEDPLLLVGNSGTGKTFLLNSISEALSLEHRHYNASLVSFDDLVGFPYPDDEKATVRFLETPATVWGAQSVLIDEISRCRPEHQNRLFSLVHERRVQGIALNNLRFRWAAMNPCSADQGGGDYLGSEPLDQALADRFGLIVEVGDWTDLSDEQRWSVANPAGEGAISNDGGNLKSRLAEWRAEFTGRLQNCPDEIVKYASTATTAFIEAGVRVSPRRSRMISRSLLAAQIVSGGPAGEILFRTILTWSLPHRASGVLVKAETVHAAHRLAWDSSCLAGDRLWIHEFHMERSIAKKIAKLIRGCPSRDAGTTAVCQCLSSEPPERAAVLAFALYPAAVARNLPIGAEGINDLGKIAQSILTVDAEISWQERNSESGTKHPDFATLVPIVEKLSGARRERARQLFYWSIAAGVKLAHPEALEAELERSVKVVAEAVK